MIYFIIGASGSGKTACMKPLQALLPEHTIHDFDSIGVPDNADKKWRQDATESWIKQLTAQDAPTHCCLLGQMVPGEIFTSPSASQLKDCSIILLDCNDTVRIQRLKTRNTYGTNQDSLNWAAWLRMHSMDPTWEPHVIMKNSSAVMCFNRLTELTAWPHAFQTHRVDSSHLTIEQTAHALTRIINPKSHTINDGNIVFTEANISDLDSIVGLLSDDPFAQSRESTSEHARSFYLEAFKTINADEHAKIMIVSYQNITIAVAQINFIQNLTYQGGMRAQIEGVRVHKDYRSQGIGKLFFAYLIAMAKERGCHLVQLTTDKSRPEALKFYQNLGFQHTHSGLKLHF